VGGAGLDTLYSRANTAFYWYQSGAHSDTSVDAGGGTALMSLNVTDLKYKTSRVWHEGNDGHTVNSTGIDADMLDTRHASYFANREEMEALLGDLLYAGLYDAAAYLTGNTATMPHPNWSGGPNVYRHGMYWVCGSSGQLDFIDADYSGRYDAPSTFDIVTTQITSNVATLTVALSAGVTSHGGVIGDYVFVSGESDAFNGRYLLTAVTATTMTYTLVNPYPNQAPTPGIGTGTAKITYDDQIPVANGDWIIAIDAAFNPTVPGHDEGSDLTLSQMTFQYIPFSTETYVKNQILVHTSAADPHPQYLTQPEGDTLYAPVVHNHQAEIRQQVINHQIQDPWVVSGWSWNPNGVVTLTVDARHSILPNSYINLKNVDPALNKKWKVLDTEAAPNQITITYGTTAPPGYTVPVIIPGAGGQVYNDPHSQYLDAVEADGLYLTELKADVRYAPIVHNHDTSYEKLGAVALHVAEPDPHPIYLTQTEGTTLFAISGHTHPEILELHPTDGANSADIWIGDTQPTYANGLAIGDLWIQTPPLGLQAPTVKTLTVSNGTTTSTVVLSWQGWAASESLSSISLERSTDGTTWPTVLTTTSSLLTYTDTGRTANTIYYYRLKGVNAAGSGGYSPIVSIVTKPADVTGVNATSSGPTNSAVSWTAPAGGTYTYEVYVNSVLAATQSGLSFTASGITENETTTFGVRSKGSTGLFGTTVSDTITSGNAPPANNGTPTVSSIDHDSAAIAWTASPSADRKEYQIYLNNVYRASTTALTYNFTGLASSTSYIFGVRTLDIGGLASTVLTVTRSTAAPPDTTPPPAPVISSFQPEGSYGRMVVRYSTSGDTVAIRVDRSTDNANWTIVQNWTGGGPGSYALDIGTFGAGTTVYCRVYVYDPAVNVSYANAAGYTLITSPTYVTAHSTNHYRANGTWNAMGTSRPVQGYYSNSSYNATGCYFYNDKPTAALYYGGRRTITGGKIWLKRMDGGTTGLLDVTMWVHKHTVMPSNLTAPQMNSSGVDIAANLVWNGAAQSIALPATWADLIVQGSVWKGIALFKAAGSSATANFMTLANLSEDANTGRLEITHLG